MPNGQFPVTYDVAAEATGYAHEDVNALIALETLKTSRGKKFMDWYNPAMGDVMIGGALPGDDEGTVRRIYDPASEFWQRRFGMSLTEAMEIDPAYGKIAEVEPMHMPSYATLMGMALDYPWTGEGGTPSEEIIDQLSKRQPLEFDYKDSGGMKTEVQWEKEESAKALEMLLAGSVLPEKMRMGDVPGGTVSYHLPDLYKTAEEWRGYEWLGGVAHKGKKQPAEELWKTAMKSMPPAFLPPTWTEEYKTPGMKAFGAYQETPDTTRTFASAISKPRYAQQLGINIERAEGEVPDTTYSQRGLFTPKSQDDYMRLLKVLLHEPFHLKTAQKDTRGYGFMHPQYSQELFDDIEQLLTNSLLAKLSKKDIVDITKRLVAGEEIDFGKYKRLDVGGE